MNYEKFKKVMIEEISKKLQAEYPEVKILLRKVNKDNDVVKDAITIYSESNTTPTLYLDDMFLDYNNGKTINELVDFFFEIIINKKYNIEFDPEDMVKWEKIKDKIVFRIVGEAFNQNYKLDSPYRIDCGNMIIYYVNIPNESDEIMCARVTNSLAEAWGINENMLYEIAMENTPKLYKKKIEKLDDSFYILTNEMFSNGASSMYYPGVLENISSEMGGDIYILPSSIHEVMVVRALDRNPTELDDLIRKANEMVVEAGEVLGDKAFIYKQKEHKLSYAVELN